MDADGWSDLQFVAEEVFTCCTSTIKLNDGAGRIVPVSDLCFGPERFVASGDFDGDGRTDAARARNGGSLTLHGNPGTGDLGGSLPATPPHPTSHTSR